MLAEAALSINVLRDFPSDAEQRVSEMNCFCGNCETFVCDRHENVPVLSKGTVSVYRSLTALHIEFSHFIRSEPSQIKHLITWMVALHKKLIFPRSDFQSLFFSVLLK